MNSKMSTKQWLRALAPFMLAAASATPALPVWADPVAKPPQIFPAEVVGLSGTSNLYVADAQGVIHFAGDPSALAGKALDWNARADITPDQVAALPLGAPYLSMSLVQIGADIYLPQPNPAFSAMGPMLFRVQSPQDLSMLGITPANYGQYVLDLGTWQQRYHLSLEQVQFGGDFALVPPPPAPAPETLPNSDNPADNGSTSDTNSNSGDIQ